MAVMFVVVLLGRLPYASFQGDIISLDPLNIDMYHLNFASEPVVVDKQLNPLGLEKLEQELLINRFSLYQFLLYHKRSHQYFPYIESYFSDSGIPDDIKYIAIAESGLQYDALSQAGARGIWQLMPETARQYGLRVDKYIDERLNFERSTRVAAAYMVALKKKFGTWTLAAAGYNRGLSGLQRDMDAQPAAKNYYDLVLNSETGNYIYRVVAIKYLMENRWKLFSAKTL
ncbi:MAG: lytic transglycosylase domain-containing protein [bacterium]